MDADLDRAIAFESVAMAFEDDLDVQRGDLVARANNRPTVGQDFDATICWMSTTAAFDRRTRYELRHTSRSVQAVVTDLHYTIDVRTLSRRVDVDTVNVNEIARISLHTSQALFFDPYRSNRVTGSFILVDPVSHESVAAGMIR